MMKGIFKVQPIIFTDHANVTRTDHFMPSSSKPQPILITINGVIEVKAQGHEARPSR